MKLEQINILRNPSLIETFLYECQCALFFIDINNQDSFKLIKDLIELIKTKNFPYLQKILVHNKFDLESKTQITNLEIKEYLDSNNSLDIQEIDLKDGHILKLLIKINSALNESKINYQQIQFQKFQADIYI